MMKFWRYSGWGMGLNLCVYGKGSLISIGFASDFCLLDNYYASGKSSAEGHQWTDAAMASDYIEEMGHGFQSYPHHGTIRCI